MYAGQNGANEHQGDPPGMKFSPRLGVVYSFNPKTVLRAGYGLYWAPWNYQAVGAANYGNIGFTQVTFISQDQFVPTDLVDQSVPSRRECSRAATVSARLEGVGLADRVHRSGQEGAEDSPVLGGSDPRASGQHCHRLRVRRRDRPRPRSRRLRTTASSTSTRCRSQHLALGAALTEQVPNPFFGLPGRDHLGVQTSPVRRSSGASCCARSRSSATSSMRQIDPRARASTTRPCSSSRSASATAGAAASTTPTAGSRTTSSARRTSSRRNSTDAQDAYNLDAEYAIGLLDVPHKITYLADHRAAVR